MMELTEKWSGSFGQEMGSGLAELMWLWKEQRPVLSTGLTGLSSEWKVNLCIVLGLGSVWTTQGLVVFRTGFFLDAQIGLMLSLCQPP